MRAARIWVVHLTGRRARTSLSVRVTAVVTTAKALTLKGRRRARWIARTSRSIPKDRLSLTRTGYSNGPRAKRVNSTRKMLIFRFRDLQGGADRRVRPRHTH